MNHLTKFITSIHCNKKIRRINSSENILSRNVKPSSSPNERVELKKMKKKNQTQSNRIGSSSPTNLCFRLQKQFRNRQAVTGVPVHLRAEIVQWRIHSHLCKSIIASRQIRQYGGQDALHSAFVFSVDRFQSGF